jgi:hypothetical protein
MVNKFAKTMPYRKIIKYVILALNTIVYGGQMTLIA